MVPTRSLQSLHYFLGATGTVPAQAASALRERRRSDPQIQSRSPRPAAARKTACARSSSALPNFPEGGLAKMCTCTRPCLSQSGASCWYTFSVAVAALCRAAHAKRAAGGPYMEIKIRVFQGSPPTPCLAKLGSRAAQQGPSNIASWGGGGERPPHSIWHALILISIYRHDMGFSWPRGAEPGCLAPEDGVQDLVLELGPQAPPHWILQTLLLSPSAARMRGSAGSEGRT